MGAKLVQVGIAAVLATAIAVSLMLALVRVDACFDPMDRYSIEVVLNKPGISYNLQPLEKLASMGYVEKVTPGVHTSWARVAYVYRSHVDEHVIVVVSLQPVPIAGNKSSWRAYYIAVRVEPVTIKSHESMYLLYYRTTVERAVDLSKLRSAIEELRSLGWLVSSRFGEHGDFAQVYLGRKLENITAAVSMFVDRNSGRTEISISILVPTRVVRVSGCEAVERVLQGSAIVKAIESALRTLGIDVRVHVNAFSYQHIEKGLYAALANSSTVKRALIHELRWLMEIGVIKGLTPADLDQIARVAKPGYAGWNSRLVYVKGRGWVPYYKLGTKAILVKGGGCVVYYDVNSVPLATPTLQPYYATITPSIKTVTVTHTTTSTVFSTVTKTVTTTTTKYVYRFPDLASIAIGVVIGVIAMAIAFAVAPKRS